MLGLENSIGRYYGPWDSERTIKPTVFVHVTQKRISFHFPWSLASSAFLDSLLVLLVYTTPRSETFANFLAGFELLNRDKDDNSGVIGHVSL